MVFHHSYCPGETRQKIEPAYPSANGYTSYCPGVDWYTSWITVYYILNRLILVPNSATNSTARVLAATATWASPMTESPSYFEGTGSQQTHS